MSYLDSNLNEMSLEWAVRLFSEQSSAGLLPRTLLRFHANSHQPFVPPSGTGSSTNGAVALVKVQSNFRCEGTKVVSSSCIARSA
jgi:hypothetical protein